MGIRKNGYGWVIKAGIFMYTTSASPRMIVFYSVVIFDSQKFSHNIIKNSGIKLNIFEKKVLVHSYSYKDNSNQSMLTFNPQWRRP